MDEEMLKTLAAQLRKPHDELGIKVGERMNESNIHMNRFTLDRLPVKTNDTVLEIGMGNGYFVNEVVSKAPGVMYTGCDFSELMIAEATARNMSLVEQKCVDFILTPANKLPFADHSFDLVFTVNTVYFWDHPEKELSEIRRVLKPGGQLLVTIRPKAVMEKFPFTAHGFILFSRDELIKLLEQNGFSISAADTIQEPDLEMNGEIMKVETVVVRAIGK